MSSSNTNDIALEIVNETNDGPAPSVIIPYQLGDGADDFDDFDDFQEASLSLTDDPANSYSIHPSGPTLPFVNGEPKELENLFDDLKTTDLPSPARIQCLDHIVNQSFTKVVRDDNNQAEQSITSDLFSDKTSQSYKIWENLLDPEESTSFRLDWESSHSFQVFLRSLKIDNKNIIDNFFIASFDSSPECEETPLSSSIPAVPNHSSTDPMIKIVTETASENPASATDLSPSPATSSLPLTSSSFTTIIPETTSSSLTNHSISTSSCESIQDQKKLQSTDPPMVPVQDEATTPSASSTLPPSSSSLTTAIPAIIKPNNPHNPTSLSTLTTMTTNQSEEVQTPGNSNNQSFNNLLDVTFFLNNPNFMQPCSSPKASVKVNESEQSSTINSESPAKPLSIISSSSTDPFHNLISHIQDVSSMRVSNGNKSQPPSSSTTPITPSESNRIFEELPLLSFMRTKLLMFPMRDSIKD